MDDDLDVTPAGSSTPKIRLYRDSLDAVDLAQPHTAQRHESIPGNSPDSTTAGIGPVDVVFRGDWVGTGASTLADRLETILDDQSVEKVDVAGATDSTRYDGTYRLAEQPGDTQPAPQTDAVFSYELRLIKE
ncbi:hypothetical protein OSG_eHP14_00200 [environmental Halophage eHP-14]|nr:hypothetical protein OSG_eHP14_00200 [environmental Halophage eHP-14]